MSMKDYLLGLITGAMAGVLFSPKSGKETREDMRWYYFEMKDRIFENLSEIKNITKDTYDNVVNSVVSGYEDTKKITAREAAEIKQELMEGYDRVKKMNLETKEPKTG
jgi:gas vesicle protein